MPESEIMGASPLQMSMAARHAAARARLGFATPRARINRDALMGRPAPVPRRIIVDADAARVAAPPRNKRKLLADLAGRRDASWDMPPAVFYDDSVANPGGTWQAIVAAACKNHGVGRGELVGGRQLPRLVRARDEAAFRMTVELDMSLTAVGRRLDRDHTSIIASLARYVRAHPGAAVLLSAVKERQKAQRQAFRATAVELYTRKGKSIAEICDLLPLSRTAVQNALREHRAND